MHFPSHLIRTACVTAVDGVDILIHCKHPWMKPLCVRSEQHIYLKVGQIRCHHLTFPMTWHVGRVVRDSHGVDMIITDGSCDSEFKVPI